MNAKNLKIKNRKAVRAEGLNPKRVMNTEVNRENLLSMLVVAVEKFKIKSNFKLTVTA